MTLSERVLGAVRAQNWELVGGVVTCEGLKGITFTQTMVKYSDAPEGPKLQQAILNPNLIRPPSAPVKNPHEDSAIEF